MTAHRPDMVLTATPGGLYMSRCLTCGVTSRASTHKPAVLDWQREHIKTATTPRPRFNPEARQL